MAISAGIRTCVYKWKSINSHKGYKQHSIIFQKSPKALLMVSITIINGDFIMKTIQFFSFLIIFVFLNQLAAGVVKETKSSVSFAGFGKFNTHTKSKIEGLQKREDTQKDFKGEGFMGSIMSKMFAKTGNTGEIIKLQEMKIYNLNHADKQYYVTPIEKMDWQQMSDEGAQDNEQYKEENDEQESHIKIIRNEFKVTDTGQTKTINQFKCRKYDILWVSEWVNTETGEKGTDSLRSVVWTTKLDGQLKKASAEEMKFNKKYMEKIGMPLDELQSEILGMNWLSMYKNMNRGQGAQYKTDDAAAFKQLQKIKGYPVVIDGTFYLKRPKKTADVQKDDEQMPSLNGLFGGLMKKAMKKKKKKPATANGFKMAFSYYTEIVQFKPASVPAKAFDVPAGYSEIER